jgi:hypothetical protein
MFKGSRGMAVRCRRCGKSIIVLNPGEIASDKSVLDGVVSEGNRSGNGSAEPAVSPAKEEYYPPPEVEQVPRVEEQARISQKNLEEPEFSVLEVELDPPVEERARTSQKDLEEPEFSVLEVELDPPVEEQARTSQKDLEEPEFSVLEVELDPPVEDQGRISQKNLEEEEFSVAEAEKKSPPGSAPAHAFTALCKPIPESPPKDRRRSTFSIPTIFAFVLLFVLFVGGSVSLVFSSLGDRVLADIGKGIEEVSTIFRS